MATIQTIWFWVIILLTTVYAILDGADLGAGILYPFARGDSARKRIISSVAPFWDASEVWLLTAVGALFAAFPVVYAEIFSRLYLPMMAAIFALIFRAISIEFIDKSESPAWKFVFGAMLFIGSALPPVVFGMAAGYLLCGRLVDTFTFLSGALVLFAFVLHGVAFLKVKSRRMFLYSSLAIVVLMAIFGLLAYFKASPMMAHLSSSEATLKTMLVIALIGLPVVVGYTIWFRKAMK